MRIRSFVFAAVTAAALVGCVVDEGEPGTESESQESLVISGLPTISLLPAPWVARHGMSASEYQSQFNYWVGKGYRLTDVSGYDVNGAVQFAALWEKKSGPAWVARHGMTSSQYQSQFNYWVGQGYRLTVIDGYDQGGSARYAAIWEKSSGPAWVARHGMTSSSYQSQFNYWTSRGYRLTWVQGYGIGGVDYYAAIWTYGTSGPAWAARHGMSSSTYQSYFNYYARLGYRLTHVSGYRVGTSDRYAAIWEKSSGRTLLARHGMTAGGYQHEFTDHQLQGYRLTQVDGYSLAGTARYAAIWVAEPNAKTGDYCRNGQCFHLSDMATDIDNQVSGVITKWGYEIRRGLTVKQHAEGPGRTSADLPETNFSVYDRFNPASVSKTITAVAALQLLHQKGIDVNTPIWTFLPSYWNIPANNKTITFAEVLNHSSGLRNADGGGDYYYANVKTLMEHEISMADKVPSYANINYALLRVLVASLDGFTDWQTNGDGSAARFINYVNDEIFSPIGIYNVKYKPTGSAPTLFYPNPPGGAHGTYYGDWTLKPGSAGGHNSIHELADFAAATFGNVLLPSSVIAELKTDGLGFGDYGTYADGTKCYGKGGFFPGNMNGGAQLSTVLVSCDNGVIAMLMLNGQMDAKSVFTNAMKAAFSAQ